MATAQRTSVEALRRELHLRFEEEEFHEPQGASELLSELVIDPKEESRFPLFFQKMVSRGNDVNKKVVPAGRRVPSKEGDALPVTIPFNQPVSNDSLPCPSSPPLAGGSQSLNCPKPKSKKITPSPPKFPAMPSLP